MSPQTIDFSKYESAAPASIDFSKYEQPEAAPNAGLAPPAGAPPKTLDSGEGPIARGMTSFETQLSKLPAGIVRTIGAKHWPIIDAHNWRELGEDVRSLNPVVSTDTGETGGVDIGATAANVLPMVAGLKGRAGALGDASELGAKGKAIAKVAGQDALSHVPVVGRVVRRPSIGDYIGAARTKVAQPVFPGAPFPEHPGVFPGANLPEHPGVFPGAPEPTATPEQLNPSLTSDARTLPGQVGKEVIRPKVAPAQPIPARSGLALPPASEAVEKPAAAPAVAAPSAKPDVSPRRIGDLLNEGLGGKPLEKGVPLRNQAKPLTNLQKQIADSAEPSKAAPRAPLTNLQKQIADSAHPLPEGFTPVESSVIKGYKYDPAKQQLSAITNAGQRYTHAEVTPEEFKEFEAAKSKGTAWNKQIRANHVQVEKNGEPTKPIAPHSATPDDLTPEWTRALDDVKAQKTPRIAKPN